MQDVFAVGGPARVVVGDDGAGQHGDGLALLGGGSCGEEGGQGDAVFFEDLAGVVFGDAVGLEGAPVAAGFGRVQPGQPCRGACRFVGGQVGDCAQDVGGCFGGGGSAQRGDGDGGGQGGGGQVEFEGGGFGAVFPEACLVLQEDFFGRGAGGGVGGFGSVLQQGDQGGELQGEGVVVAGVAEVVGGLEGFGQSVPVVVGHGVDAWQQAG